MDYPKNMDNKQDLLQQIAEFLGKWWAWAAWVVMGLVGKMGIDLSKNRKMNFWQWVGSTMVGCFVGYLACVFCQANYPKQGALIVPIATLISDRVMMFLLSMNWTPIIEIVLQKQIKNRKK